MPNSRSVRDFHRSKVRLVELSIGGFKSYVNSQSIGFSPLTVIYGSNASGKSSILQALRFIGINARLSSFYEVVDGNIVSSAPGLDLGDFLNFVSGHNGGRVIDFSVKALVQIAEEEPFEYSAEFQLSRSEQNPTGELTSLTLSDGNLFLRFRKDRDDSGGRVNRDRNLTEVEMKGVGQDDFLPTGQRVILRGFRIVSNSIADSRNSNDQYRQMVSIYQQVMRQIGSYLYVGPHREQLPRVAYTDTQVDQFESVSSSTGRDYWNKWLRTLVKSPAKLQRVNSLLKDLDIPYSMGIERFPLHGMSDLAVNGSPIIPYFIDRDSGVEVFAKDIGYGVSQVLPIVMASSLERNDDIHLMIEQPELHLHPRLQGNLANMFVDAAKNGAQISLETHSEHIILRIQKMIRTGQCDPSLVKVLFVERSQNGAIVHELRINEIGDFIDDWPGGFFEERLEELF